MRIALLSLLLTSLPALAEDVIEYEFDMILFENLSANESFLSDHTAREFINRSLESNDAESAESETAVETQGPVVYSSQDPTINFRELPEGALDDAEEKLRKSASYRVISRHTWRQSGFTDGDSIEIEIDTPDPDDTSAVIQIGGADPSKSAYLSGAVRFTFSRYIHLSTDLVKNHSLDNTEVGLPALDLTDSTRIVMERKLRSSETHYVDHPLLGIIVDIKRIRIENSEG